MTTERTPDARVEAAWTPAVEDIRTGYAQSRVIHAYYTGGQDDYERGLAEFDRWWAIEREGLTERVAEVLRGHHDLSGYDWADEPYSLCSCRSTANDIPAHQSAAVVAAIYGEGA